jgi:hypothetical protein
VRDKETVAQRSIAVVPRTPLAVLLSTALLSLLAFAAAPAQAKGPTVRAELTRLQEAGELLPETAAGYRQAYDAAQKTLKKLHGFRHAQLKAVVANVDALAAGRRFTPSRLRAEFLTLARNRAWWAARPLPGAGQRTSFPGSQLVWQFYPGQGWQIQWLGTFGKANALWSIKTRDDDLRALLDEALGLATQRAGGLAFEYLFRFDGGRPPWVSGLAQGTGLSAFSRAAVRLGEPRYFDAARGALGIFRTPPPTGVRRTTKAGAHYLQYSFAPKLRIANGFAQSLNGLHDFAALANDDEGRALFAAGEAQLRDELPAFDTGAWSLYSVGAPPSRESDLGYHKVLRDFLQGLCDRLTADRRRAGGGVAAGGGAPDPAPYCDTARRFTADLHTPPTLAFAAELPTLRAKKDGRVPFTLDKVSTVTMTATRAGRLVLARTVRLGRGRHAVELRPESGGPLRITVRAVDLAGNAASERAVVHVRPAPEKRHAKKHKRD